MRSIRLLPIVMMAAFALLLLKTVGLITQGSYVLTGTDSAFAQPVELSDSEVTAAEKASQNLFTRQAPTPISSSQIDAVVVRENKDGDKIAIGSIDGVNNTERAVLERLSERRVELDLLSNELDIRVALIDAAEQRLEQRVAGLEALEARITALVDERKALDDAQFKGLVSMYETMKPGDAAEIFDALNMEILLKVSRSMSSRKMAIVLAKMSRERAMALTQRLAVVEVDPTFEAPTDDVANLPQIIGQ